MAKHLLSDRVRLTLYDAAAELKRAVAPVERAGRRFLRDLAETGYRVRFKGKRGRPRKASVEEIRAFVEAQRNDGKKLTAARWAAKIHFGYKNIKSIEDATPQYDR